MACPPLVSSVRIIKICTLLIYTNGVEVSRTSWRMETKFLLEHILGRFDVLVLTS